MPSTTTTKPQRTHSPPFPGDPASRPHPALQEASEQAVTPEAAIREQLGGSSPTRPARSCGSCSPSCQGGRARPPAPVGVKGEAIAAELEHHPDCPPGGREGRLLGTVGRVYETRRPWGPANPRRGGRQRAGG